MANPDLGTKRLCSGCGAKFYDLNRSPILCPKCGTAFEIHETARARPDTARSRKQVEEEEPEIDTEEEDGVDIVSLEEAEEEEETPTRKVVVDDDDEEEAEELDDELDDDAFLEEDEDDDDVSGLIGDVEEDDEV